MSLIRILEIVKFKDKSFIWDKRCVYLYSIIMEIVFFIIKYILINRKKILMINFFGRIV